MTIRDLFFKHVAQTSKDPLDLEVSKAQGIYIYDQNGRPVIDLISGVSVSNIGHSNPQIIEAVKRQVEDYMQLMVYGELIQTPQVLLAEKLCSFLPDHLNSVYFVNSGSEAVEGGLKLARRYTGRKEFIACKNAYHGSTMGAMSVMGDEDFKQAFQPLVETVHFIEHGCLKDLEKITTQTAGVIIEVVQGENGIRQADKSYWQALRRRCDETGALLILDEIQTGMGRTGRLFAFQHYDISPDILLLAKAFGGGMPLGAFVADGNVMEAFTHDPVLGHITTFGGHPVCCAAGLANFKLITEQRLWQDVEKKSALFEECLKTHPLVKEIRRLGFMIAVELNDTEKVMKMIKVALKKGAILDWFLFCDTAYRIAPPLIITESEIRQACKILRDSMDEL